jgi:NhaP-type Na+/H+ or K+/H+ antiporter
MDNPLLLIAVAGAVGLFAAMGARSLRSPQVVGYVVVGVVLGAVLKIIRPEQVVRMGTINAAALGIIGFIIGSELAWSKIRRLGRAIFSILMFESLGALVLVMLAVWFITGNWPLALILGALASATAPAGTVDVLQEYRASGPLTTTIYAVVGLDDVTALLAFGFCLPLARTMLAGTHDFSAASIVLVPLEEIGLSVAIGIGVGLVGALLGRLMRTGAEMLVLALSMVFLCSGLCDRWHLSLILANMAMAIVLVNAVPHLCGRMVAVLREFSAPIYVVFFVLVGARLDPHYLKAMGLVGVAAGGAYVACRTVGKWLGSIVGGKLGRATPVVTKYIGFGLFSQAGVAIGLALATSSELARVGTEAARSTGADVIAIITATTFIVQIIGPPFLKHAIVKAGEAKMPTRPSGGQT